MGHYYYYDIYYYTFLVIGTFVTTLVGTRGVILLLRHRRLLLDVPNTRSNHAAPTPRGGGIAVVLSLMIFLIVDDQNYLMVFSMLLLAAVSLVDDWIRLSPLTRLVAQAIAVCAVLPEVSFPFSGGLLPHGVESALLGVAWLWFINLFNFMDGIDGLAASETIAIGMGILFVTSVIGTFGGPLSLAALIVLASGAGFLWWNVHPARIFLGDVGSVPLGYLLGYLLLQAARAGYGYAALILPAYYLCDATITLARRAWRGQKVWEAHSEHFYQQAVRAGRSHDAVVLVVNGVNMLLILLACLASLYPDSGWMYLAIAYGMVLAVLGFVFRTHLAEKAA